MSRLQEYQSRRYGSVTIEPAFAPVAPPPIQRELSHQELRATGGSLASYERGLRIVQNDISELRDDLRDDLRRLSDRYQRQKERGGVDRASYDAKRAALEEHYASLIAQKQAVLDRRLQAYRSAVGEFEAQGVNVSAARAAAPKHYRTDLANAGRYAPGSEPNRVARPGSGYTGIGSDPGRRYGSVRVSVQASRFAERRNDAEQYRRASEAPGTYRLSDGSKIVSTLEVGRYGGATVLERREPVGSRVDGGFLFRTTKFGEQAPGVIYGFDVNDASTRDSLRQNAGQFRTVGEMFGASQASYNVPKPSARYRLEGPESPRLRALYGISDSVSRYQAGYEKRQERLNRVISRLSFGGGAPEEARSGWGRFAHKSVRFVTSPIWGPAATADNSILAYQKTFLYSGALLTPETRKAAKAELRGTVGPVAKSVYTDPETYAYALLGGSLLGRRMSAPRSVSIRGGTGIWQESVSPGAGIVQTKAVATYKYAAGPFNLYKWQRNAPARGNLIYHTEPTTGNLWVARAESVASTTYKGKPLYVSENWLGTYNPKTQVLALRNSKGGFYFGQESKGVGVFSDGVSAAYKSNTRYMTLGSNRRGIPSVDGVGYSTGIGEQWNFQRLRYARASTPYGELDVFGAGRQGYFAQSQRYAKTFKASGGSTDLFSAGFGDLRRVGLWRDPRIEQRPMFRDQFQMFLRDRRGSLRGSSAFEEVLTPKPTRQRNPFGGREPAFGGIPLGGLLFRYRPVVGFAPRYSSGSRSAVAQRPALRSTQATIPAWGVESLIGQRSITGQRPRTVTIPRYDFAPRTVTVPRETLFLGFPPLISIPRGPPIIPPVPPLFGGGSVSGGYAGGGGTRRSYGYAPSLVALAYGITRTSKGGKDMFLGLEVRPILRPRRRRR